MAFLAFALLLITGCLLAKRYILGSAIASGLGTPTNSYVPGMFFSGLAFSAPIQSAILLAFLPLPLLRRLGIACAWMVVAVLAFVWGNQAFPMHDTPSLFRSSTTSALPCLALGWFIPLGYYRTVKGWQFSLSSTSIAPRTQGFSIASLFGFTLIVSLCLFSLQFGSEGSYRFGLLGCLIGLIMGAASILPIYWIMKLQPAAALALFLAIGIMIFVGIRYAMLLAGAGGLAFSNSVFLSTLWLSTLFGITLAKLGGVQLVTGKHIKSLAVGNGKE